jgi:hypothetical protein
MLQGSKIRIFDSVEDAINAAVMEIKKWQIFLKYSKENQKK